jgi:hypothetical protein
MASQLSTLHILNIIKKTIYTSYITFSKKSQEYTYFSQGKCDHKIFSCAFRQDSNFNFVNCLFASLTSATFLNPNPGGYKKVLSRAAGSHI